MFFIMSSTNVLITSSIIEEMSDNINDDQYRDFDVETVSLQASKTIVIHPGSLHLHLGRASDTQPVVIPHVIAWRHKCPGSQITSRMEILRKHYIINDEELRKMNNILYEYSGRYQNIIEEVCKVNEKKQPQELSEPCGWTWTDTSHNPTYLISDDALYIKEDDCYDLFWPVVNGQLNTKSKSLTAVIADLEALWTKAIVNYLNISASDFCNYRCILIIPDIYVRNHIKHIVDMLLMQMKFSSIIVHQESVCSTYGCGIANACVVDVGHQKTAICCVEDGFSHSNTRICMDMGGSDLTSVFASLLKKSCFPYTACDVKNRMDFLLLEELKEAFCHLDMERVGPEHQEFSLRRPGQTSLLYSFLLGNEALQAPLSLFFPNAFYFPSDASGMHFATKNSGDYSDPFDDSYLASTRTKQEEAWASKKEKAAATEEKNEPDRISMQQSHGNQRNASIDFTQNLIGIDNAIVWSIENCPESYEDEVKRRMYSCILIVGGGIANFSGMESFIQQRVISLMSTESGNFKSHVKVVINPKAQDSSSLAWKGGSVLSSLDNAQDLWIERENWINHGLRLLREKCPFVW